MLNDTILSKIDEIDDSFEETEEDEIANFQFQKDQLELRGCASKQSKAEIHRHKPPKEAPSKKIKMTDEEKRILDILEGNPQISKVSNNCLRLSSLATDKVYDVTLAKEGCNCTCLAKQRWKRNQNCKHIVAVAILLGIKKDGEMKAFLKSSERKSIEHCLSLFDGEIDEERKHLFLTEFKSDRDLKTHVDKPAQDSSKSSKVRTPAKLNLNESISTYQEAKQKLDEHASEFNWTLDVNKDARRQCPNHLPLETQDNKKIAVGERAIVGEYLHIWMKKTGIPIIVKETKYFHENCITEFKARILHEDYVNLRPPKNIEIVDTSNNQFVEKFIKDMNIMYPLMTFQDSTGNELRIGENGMLKKQIAQPGLAELRAQIKDGELDLDIEDSEDEYFPSSHSTTSDVSFTSPVKKKTKKK